MSDGFIQGTVIRRCRIPLCLYSHCLCVKAKVVKRSETNDINCEQYSLREAANNFLNEENSCFFSATDKISLKELLLQPWNERWSVTRKYGSKPVQITESCQGLQQRVQGNYSGCTGINRHIPVSNEQTLPADVGSKSWAVVDYHPLISFWEFHWNLPFGIFC